MGTKGYKSSRRRHPSRPGLLALVAAVALSGCYAASAARHSGRIVDAGFDLEEFGPWVIFTGPGSLLVAGGNLLLGSVIPLRGGVNPREPEAKWFRAYPGSTRDAEEVAILCHRDRATWITGIRRADGGAWEKARYEKWHFPICIEALPGRYELEVHYFWRETDDDVEESVSRQAESTEPTTVLWRADAGQVYLLSPEFGQAEPAKGAPPQRHIPRSRDIGTSWWALEESDWSVRIERVADTRTLEGPLLEQRRAWMSYESGR